MNGIQTKVKEQTKTTVHGIGQQRKLVFYFFFFRLSRKEKQFFKQTCSKHPKQWQFLFKLDFPTKAKINFFFLVYLHHCTQAPQQLGFPANKISSFLLISKENLFTKKNHPWNWNKKELSFLSLVLKLFFFFSHMSWFDEEKTRNFPALASRNALPNLWLKWERAE